MFHDRVPKNAKSILFISILKHRDKKSCYDYVPKKSLKLELETLAITNYLSILQFFFIITKNNHKITTNNHKNHQSLCSGA